ncbi:MAG: type II secretion system protein [Synergistaceae bacterium]|nr:type II secretion system protein [Synergistaceae bacterium]MBR0186695.1 type II secretion system protein [Synergistaceae bacterium]
MKKRRAFTLTELIVGVVVMIVTLGVATMSLRSMDQTAKRETERLVAIFTGRWIKPNVYTRFLRCSLIKLLCK